MSERKEASHGMRPTTAVIAKGFDPRLSVGSARPAVFRSSTYVFSSPEAAERAFAIASGRAKAREGEQVELIYARINHPNAEILEEQIVPLERGAQGAVVFNSGMAAIVTALTTFLRPGQSLVHTVPLYGGTQRLTHEFLQPFGISTVAVRASDGAALDAAIAATPNLGAVFIETPSNPTMVMTGIRRAADAVARRASGGGPRALVMVDNTFLGPTFQHPLMLGADLVVYSATKYLSGFSDMLAGVVLARDGTLVRPLRASRVMFGNILQPDECWMLDGRLPTVALRMNKQSKNAQRIAERLAKHTRVAKMHYPTLFEDPEQVRIRDAQCEFPGAVFSMDLRGGRPAAFDFLRGLQLVRNAVSLGGVETLACHPKTTTHSGLSDEEMETAGITDSLVRVSVGIEDWRDVLADFEQALDAV